MGKRERDNTPWWVASCVGVIGLGAAQARGGRGSVKFVMNEHLYAEEHTVALGRTRDGQAYFPQTQL